VLINTNVYPDVDTFGIGIMRALRCVDSPEETDEGCIEMQPAAFISPTYRHTHIWHHPSQLMICPQIDKLFHASTAAFLYVL
jgi:hypothetical protein